MELEDQLGDATESRFVTFNNFSDCFVQTVAFLDLYVNQRLYIRSTFSYFG